ncbi:MAG: UPF0280 family protein [Actinomycetota bacterium]|nr:UPF0280 family protein [Actinomycetota bacterium]
MTYQPRTYRRMVDSGDLACFEVTMKETDLQVCALTDLTDEAEDLVVQARWELENFIRRHPRFSETYVPFEVPDDAPSNIKSMADAAKQAGVGPMASVAGMIAEHVAYGLAKRSPEVIVENGGDTYLIGGVDRTIALYAGADGVANVGLEIRGGLMPIAVCTSSGRIGHSESFGDADAVTVLARNGALADAVATGLANRIHTHEDIHRAVEAAKQVHGVLGVVATVDGHIGAWGNVRLTSLD